MPIEDPKNLNLGPVWYPWLSLLRLDHIQNDRDSILVGFPDRANIGICGKRSNCAKGLRWDFTRLKLLQGCLLLGFGSLDQLVDLLLQNGVFSLFWTLDLGLGLFKRAHYLKLTWVVSGRFRSWSLLFLERGRVKVIRLILILCCQWGEELSDSGHNRLCVLSLVSDAVDDGHRRRLLEFISRHYRLIWNIGLALNNFAANLRRRQLVPLYLR